MKEKQFYEICDTMGKLVEENITEGYFPTVEELKANRFDKKVEEYLPFLAYFAADPYKKVTMENDEREKYEEMVIYVKKLLLNYKFD